MLDKLKVKRSHMWLLSSIFAGAVLTLGSGVSYAQRRPPGTAILSGMPGQAIVGRYRSGNWDVSIGREMFEAAAVLSYSSSYSGISLGSYNGRRNPTEVTFRLAASNQASQYRKLTLSFGLADDNIYARGGAVTRLSIYRDGEFYGYTDVSLGQQKSWVVDVSNTRSLALEASCTRVDRNDRCAGIFFFEEILEP